mmetsp:Transcript_4772/g.10950  ORF Transcript_4772/g.10950 Transcript_4772/m.10950 type:complete len:116 (-) Transcript_4772:96-443(-)
MKDYQSIRDELRQRQNQRQRQSNRRRRISNKSIQSLVLPMVLILHVLSTFSDNGRQFIFNPCVVFVRALISPSASTSAIGIGIGRHSRMHVDVDVNVNVNVRVRVRVKVNLMDFV